MQNEFTHINELSAEIHEANKAKGFWDERIDIPHFMQVAQDLGGWPAFTPKQVAFVKHAILSQQLMLAVSEIAEAQEALRKDRIADLDAFDAAVDAGVSFEDAFKAHIKDTFEDEIADAVIRLFDSAGGALMDLGRHIMLKLLFNSKRPYKHGKNA